MQYDLIKDNSIVQTATFVPEEIPTPSDKGTWLERVDTMPEYDPSFKYTTDVHTVTATQSITSRDLVYLPLEVIQGNLTRLIDMNTRYSILATADETKQRNMAAKSIILTRKESLGTISVDETVELNDNEAVFTYIEATRSEGNAKEALVNSAGATVADLEGMTL